MHDACTRQPFGCGQRIPFGFNPLAEIAVIFGMASRDHIVFAALAEFFQRIGARGLRQPQAWLIIHLSHHQRLGNQFRDITDDLAFTSCRLCGHRCGSLEREAAGEDRKAAQDPLLGLGSIGYSSSRGWL